MNNLESFMEILNVLFLICFVWLVVCLIKFIRSKNEPARRRKDKIFLILSALALACSTGALVGFLWLLNSALAHM